VFGGGGNNSLAGGGNFVQAMQKAQAGMIAKVAQPITGGTDTLQQNQYLATGSQLTSQGGNYVLVMQTDGNLVGYNANQIGSGAWWASNTAGKGNNLIAQMQNDGNFVIYPSNSTGGPISITPFSGALWASGSSGKGVGPYRLVMQSDRNIVVYDGNNQPQWASGTNVSNPPPSQMVAPVVANQTTNIGMAPISQVPAPGVTGASWTYQGCFNDGNHGQAGPRVLKNNIGQVTSASQCTALAQGMGYNVSGLQYGGQCWADTNVAYDAQGAQQNCPPLGPAWGNQVSTSSTFVKPGVASMQTTNSAAAVSTVPNASKKYWGPQTGIDYPGNDLGNTQNSDPDMCATVCDNNPQCVGYVLGTDGPNCWLKGSFQNPTASNTRTASVKPGQPAPPGLAPTAQVPAPGVTGASAPVGASPMSVSPMSASPMAGSPVASILAASPPASSTQVAACLNTLQSCIAATPDASSPAPAPATGTSGYILEGAPYGEFPTSKKILNLFFALLVVFLAMLMMMKTK
jgi:hypothetical protein